MVVVFVLQKLPARVSLITLVIKKLDGRENVYNLLPLSKRNPSIPNTI